MKNKYAYLHSFVSLLPQYHFQQSTLIDWVVSAHVRSQELIEGSNSSLHRLKRFAVNPSFIKQRYVEYGDASQNWEEHELYSLTPKTPQGASIEKRNQFYSSVTQKRISQFYAHRPIPDHLIHVTCTGYTSPSAPQVYFSKLNKSPAITHAYHMGCYASLPAIRIGSALALNENKKIDIIHNEICSIHLKPNDHLPEQVVVQTLFADGHISYQISEDPKDFKIIGIKEKIIPETTTDMTWIPSSNGMAMTLSRKVPDKIENNIIPFVMEMAQEFGIDLSHMIKKGVFAIHPGGPRIIEVIKQKLELKDDQIQESKTTLYERGNMSSATLPHVWKLIIENNYPPGTLIISLAFGPGLTVFGSVFEVV